MGEASLAGAALLFLLLGNGSGGGQAFAQPPAQTGELANEPVFRGWNVVSIHETQWKAANDFQNANGSPVTGFNWLGSYVSWRETTLPAVSPTAFWFGIYDNTPTGDRPGNLVWSYTTTNFSQNFAGYDGLDHGILDSAFRYSVDLPEQSWFTPTGPGTTNWLSIAAVYGGDVPPVYQWGWKTTPEVTGATGVWLVGDPPNWVPLQWDGHGWDTVFEIKRPGPVIPEVNSLGLVAIASGMVSLFRLTGLRRARTR